ncbi:MAG: recombinase family protein [Nocardioides sp.]|nr:recombinase family protein [Nocardioides sp.]
MSGSAVIYSRISSDREGREVGVEIQEADCRALAEREGYTVVGVYRDNDISASTISTKPRPSYDAMLARVREGDITAMIAYSNSRLTRRPLEIEGVLALHKATGVRLATVVSGEDDLSTADGRMVARIKGNIDAAEAERTAERVLRSKAASKALGAYLGGPRPFGYDADGVTLRPDEAALLQQAAADVLDGVPLGRIVRAWNIAGVRTSRGREWRAPSLVKTLTRPRNAGLVESAGDYVTAIWPPLMTRERWEAVCAVLADPSRRTNGGYHTPRWLLTGIAVCGVDGCGMTMRHTVTRGIPTYRCSGASCTSRRQDVADDFVTKVIAERLRRDDARDLLDGPDLTDERPELRRKVTELTARLDALAADTNLSERMLAKRAAVLEAELDDVGTRLDALNLALAASRPLSAVAGAADPSAAFLAADLDVRRAVVDALATVTFLPNARRGRPKGWRPGDGHYFDPETVRITWKGAR